MIGKRRVRVRAAIVVLSLLLAVAVFGGLPAKATAEQASQPSLAAAGALDVGEFHSCALLADGQVRCWGFGEDGQLGYANTDAVGDDETPGSVGPVALGSGRRAAAIAAGDFHTCAVLDDATVRCWGLGGDGRLGYASTVSVGDDEAPGSAGSVDLGSTARTISAGSAHTCAVLVDGSVRCWGFGFDGRLGYGNTNSIGDNETPASAGPVDLGAHTAKAITAGDAHTCAILEDKSVRCWGNGSNGRLGYASETNVGDRFSTPNTAGPVDLGPGHTAKAITAGGAHTCAVLEDNTVRCWGYGGNGRLGYANTANIGDNERPGSVGPVDLGLGRTAKAISAGEDHTCAMLDDGSVRCWGYGADGRLGYANTNNVGDKQTPGSFGPVDLGSGRTAVAISAGRRHTCVRLDDGSVRCWGYGGDGRLGYCNQQTIGDNETPASAGPVSLAPRDSGVRCPTPPPGSSPSVGSGTPSTIATSPTGANKPSAASDAVRARGLHSCLAGVRAHAKREQTVTRRGSARQRAKAKRHVARHRSSARRQCLRRFGRAPGQVTRLVARTLGATQIELSFIAAGTDGNHPPAAHGYLIKQSRHPIRSERDFARAQALCHGSCRFTASEVSGPPTGKGSPRRCLAQSAMSRLPARGSGGQFARASSSLAHRASRQAISAGAILLPGACISLTVTDLKAHATYYYAIAARDNVSAKRGRRSQTVKARTR